MASTIGITKTGKLVIGKAITDKSGNIVGVETENQSVQINPIYKNPSSPDSIKSIIRGGGGGSRQLPTLQDVKDSLMVEAVAQPTNKLDKASTDLRDEILRRRTANLRAGGRQNLGRERDLFLLAGAKEVIDTVRSTRDLPKTAVEIYKNPSTIKELPGAIKKAGASFGRIIKESPGEAVAIVTANALLFKGTQIGFKSLSKISTKVLKKSLKLSNRLSQNNKFKIIFRTQQGDKVLIIPNLSEKSLLKVKTVLKNISKKTKIKTIKGLKTINRPFIKIENKIKIIADKVYKTSKIPKEELEKLFKELKKLKASRSAAKFKKIQKLRGTFEKRLTKRNLDLAKYNFRKTYGRKLTKLEAKQLKKLILRRVRKKIATFKEPSLKDVLKKKVRFNKKIKFKSINRIEKPGIRSTIKETTRNAANKIKRNINTSVKNSFGRLETKLKKLKASRSAAKFKKIQKLRGTFEKRLTKRNLDLAKYNFRKTYGRKLTKLEAKQLKKLILRRVRKKIATFKEPSLKDVLKKKVRFNKKIKFRSINRIEKPGIRSRIKDTKIKTINILNKKVRISSNFIRKPIKNYIRKIKTTRRTARIKKLRNIVESRLTKRGLDRAKYAFRKTYGRKLTKAEAKILKRNIRKTVLDDFIKAESRAAKMQELKFIQEANKRLPIKVYSRGKLRPAYRIRKINYKESLGKIGRKADLKGATIIKDIPKGRTVFKVTPKKGGKTFKIAKFRDPEIPKGHVAVKSRNGQIIILKKPKNILRTGIRNALKDERFLSGKIKYNSLGGKQFLSGKIKYNSLGKFISALSIGFLAATKLKQKSKQKSKQISRQGSKQKSAQAERQKSRSGQKYATAQIQAQAQAQALKEMLRYRQKTKQIFARPEVIKPAYYREKEKKLKSKGKKLIPAFNVYGKSGKKFIKINKKPLSQQDALSRGAYAVDHSTSKTFKIIPAGRIKKTGAIRAKENKYFNRKGFKLRSVKIRKGRKFKLLNKYIEKRRFGIDTRGEKRGLSLARLRKLRKW